MNILITLCARGGSKGIPGKNIKLLNGIPLIGYSLQIANDFKNNVIQHQVDIALSTDSFEIIETVKQLGLSTDYIRPEYLANDTAGKLEVFMDIKKHYECKNNIKYDYLLDLDVTSPLRNLEDLLAAFEIIQKDAIALNLFSVNRANKNPYFNLVEQNEEGYYELSKKRKRSYLSRQTAPKVYELNASFYFFKKEFFNSNLKSVFSEKSLIYEMPHICFDLDHKIDFEFMEFLLSNNKLDFKL
jgi:CMP-N-acetylneuraminic acid synthetase